MQNQHNEEEIIETTRQIVASLSESEEHTEKQSNAASSHTSTNSNNSKDRFHTIRSKYQ